MKINIYTDGAARGNPGPGGYGIVLESGSHRKELMELLAVIDALRALKTKNAEVFIYSDSKYVVDTINKGWIFGWEKKGYKGKKNPDL